MVLLSLSLLIVSKYFKISSLCLPRISESRCLSACRTVCRPKNVCRVRPATCVSGVVKLCLSVGWRSPHIANNGRNYMQLGIAGCFPVEPRCRCCGLRTLLSAPKPQLTYSFCYWLLFFLSFFLFSGCHGFVRLNLQIVGETVCRFIF